jgi:hypothetical protein
MMNAGVKALCAAVLGCVLPIVVSTPAAAQSSDGRVFGRVLGGATFGTETGALIAAGGGVRVAPHLVLIGEAGRFSNVLPKELQRDLDRVAPLLEPQFGRPLVIDGGARAVYAVAGLRVSGRESKRVSVFAEAAAGRARGTSVIHASVAGADVTNSVERALGLPRSETHNMYSAGAGLSIGTGRHTAVELGYRFVRIQLGADDPRINASVAHLSVRVGF